MNAPLNFYHGFIARLDGPLHFRFYAQPIVAAFLAIRDGISDARKAKPPYLWTILTDPRCRREFFHSGLKSVGKVIFFAAVMDLIYQLLEFRAVRAVGLIYAALLLAVIPYLLIRGPANRVARWNAQERRQRGKRLANS